MIPGEVRELGRHRLLCGDAFNPDYVKTLMAGVKPDMLLCDPPYGMNLNANFGGMKPWLAIKDRPRNFAPGRNGTGRDYAPVVGDSVPFDPTPLILTFDRCREQFWWGADYYSDSLPERDKGSWLVWDKRNAGKLDKMFGSSFELCWSRKRHKRDIIRVMWAGVWGTQWEAEHKRVHPTQKPVKLAEWFIQRYSKPGAVIVDLFAGSGSTLLACERLGRTCYTMEILPEYCDLIVDRYNRTPIRTAVEKSRGIRQQQFSCD